MSVSELERPGYGETIAGYMSTAAIFVALIGVVVRPLPLTVAALALSLVATGVGGRWGRLHAIAVGVATASFIVGMTIAVITGRPLY